MAIAMLKPVIFGEGRIVNIQTVNVVSSINEEQFLSIGLQQRVISKGLK